MAKRDQSSTPGLILVWGSFILFFLGLIFALWAGIQLWAYDEVAQATKHFIQAGALFACTLVAFGSAFLLAYPDTKK